MSGSAVAAVYRLWPRCFGACVLRLSLHELGIVAPVWDPLRGLEDVAEMDLCTPLWWWEEEEAAAEEDAAGEAVTAEPPPPPPADTGVLVAPALPAAPPEAAAAAAAAPPGGMLRRDREEPDRLPSLSA